MAWVDSTFAKHQVRLTWAVCAYDDQAHQWESVRRQWHAHVRLLLVINHNASSFVDAPGQRPLRPGQRKARMVLHRRLVRRVWALADDAGCSDTGHKPAGRQGGYDAVWLPDDDLELEGFDLAEFFFRWQCAFAGGPPIVAQPSIDQHGRRYGRHYGKSFPANGDTWRLCASGQLGRRLGCEACFLRETVALRVGFVENQAALLDATFLLWLWNTSVIERIARAQLRLKAEAGPDAIWCGAAAEWASLPRGADGEAAVGRLRVPRRQACAIITTAIGHADGRSLGGRTQAHFDRGFAILDAAGIRASKWRMNQPLPVGCRRQNCTRHRWFRYQPVPGWTLPDDEDGLRQVRACALMRDEFARGIGGGCGGSSGSPVQPEPRRAGSPRCDELEGLYWRTNPL